LSVETVIGRERELSLAEEFVASASSRLSALLLEGEPGIGKTTVWREVIRYAEERGFLVLTSRAAQTEVKLSLAAVADLLEPMPRSIFDTLPDPQRRALDDIALLHADPTGAPADRRTVATAVRSTLSALSSQQPLLVAIDDTQWLDPASAATLSFALRRLTHEPIGFLASRRVGDEVALSGDALVESGFSVRTESKSLACFKSSGHPRPAHRCRSRVMCKCCWSSGSPNCLYLQKMSCLRPRRSRSRR
jgi:predicted ATPase